jgi:hypothetical protein
MSHYVRSLAVTLLLVGCTPTAPLEAETAALAAPDWMGNASYVISRACSGPCEQDARPLANGYFYDDWAWSRATAQVGWFDVWKAGVTDWDNPDVWQALDVRVHSRVGSQGAFSSRWIDFAGRVGDNARYTLPLGGALDPFFDPTRGGRKAIERSEDCPSFPFRVGEDGRSLEADVELYFTVNGAELRPGSGATFRGMYSTSMVTPGVCASTALRVLDQPGSDVAVLEAWFGTRVTASTQPPSLGGSRFDLSKCNGEDCTDSVAALLTLEGADRASPFVNVFRYPGLSSGICETIELRTVTRAGALVADTFAGIGFWWNGSFGFVSPDRLHEVGRVTLKDGSPGVVHRFLAQGMCFGQGGNSGSILSRRFEFKPYARFDVPATQYRIWDDVPQNYLLGRSPQPGYVFIDRIDRRSELITF